MKKTITSFVVALFMCVTVIITPMYMQKSENTEIANADNTSELVADEFDLSDKDEQIVASEIDMEIVNEKIGTQTIESKSEMVNKNDLIEAELKAKSVVDYYYTESGITVTEINFDNNVLNVEFKADEGLGKLDIFVQNKALNWEKSSLFTYTINEKSFVSNQSEDDAWYKALLYNYEEGLLTNGEIQKNYSVFSRRDIIEEITTDSKLPSDITSGEEVVKENLSNSSVYKAAIEKATYVTGRIMWETSTGQYLPLRNTRIDLFDDEPIGFTYIKMTKTDDQGYYSFTFSNDDGFWESGGYDVFIRCYPDSTTFQIARDWALPESTFYNFDSSVTHNVSTGSTTNINLTITYNVNNMVNCTFYIAQGMIVAQNFAYAMGFRAEKMLNVVFPFSPDDSAFCYNKYCGIGKDYFDDFDVVMHEYGHFVEGEMGNYGSNLIEIILYDPSHVSYADHFSDKNNKQFAMHLTWSEAWATAFSQIAQEYFKFYYAGKVAGFGDIKYHKTNYETFTLGADSCEAQEDAVISFLWDLYDTYAPAVANSNSVYEAYDNLGWGYSKWWQATTKSGTTTISKFLENIETNYTSELSQVGELLGAHQIAPSNLAINNLSDVSTENPPVLSWKVNGSNTNPNDRFRIVFYDYNGRKIYETSYFNSSLTQNQTFTYSVKNYDWIQVLNYFYRNNLENNSIYFAVKGYHAKLSPISGPFTSKFAVLTKNLFLSKSLNIASNSRYTEDIVHLDSEQYCEYNLTFASTGFRTIQTFGESNTFLNLYNENGTLIGSDDNSGYKNNSYLCYKFNANVKYKLKIKLCYSSSGEYKLIIIPDDERNYVSSFDKIFEGPDGWRGHYDNLSFNTVSYVKYKTSISKTVTFTLNADYDTYLYIIDPRSTKAISNLESEPSTFDDDDGGGLQAKIVKTLEADVPYLIIIAAFNPSTMSGDVYLKFS